MVPVVLVFSFVIVALGALGVVSPSRLLGLVHSFQTPAGLYAAIALRVLFGVALFLAAPTSRSPELIRIVGIVIVVAAVITPVIGLERLHEFIDWWSARGSTFLRVWAACAFALGLLLAYAVLP